MVHLNKLTPDVLEGADIAKNFKKKIPPTKMAWPCRKNESQNLGHLTTDGTRKRGGACKRWWDEVGVNLNIRGKKKPGRQLSKTVGNRGRMYYKPRSTWNHSA